MCYFKVVKSEKNSGNVFYPNDDFEIIQYNVRKGVLTYVQKLTNFKYSINIMNALLVKSYYFLFYVFYHKFIYAKKHRFFINNKINLRQNNYLIHCAVIFTCKQHELTELSKSIINIGEL